MQTQNQSTKIDISQPYPLNEDQIAQFEQDGYIKLKDVFSKEELETYRGEITRMVKQLNKEERSIDERDTYAKAFLQIENIWLQSEHVREFVFGKRLARIATKLLRTQGVRLYHDQALYKESSGGYTPWHVDQVYWPLASEKTVTAWIPMHAVPIENGPLCFAKGSQRLRKNRDIQISDESEKLIQEQMKLSDCAVDESPYALGEVSFHLGYNFHRAGPNKLDRPREVMTVIYMDSDMRLAEPKSSAQQQDWENWCPGAVVGEVIDSPFNPVLYEKTL